MGLYSVLGNIFSGKKHLFIIFLYLSDLFMLLLSFTSALTIVYGDILLIPNLADTGLRLAMVSFIILTLNYLAFGLYKDKRNLFDDVELMGILYSSITAMAAALAFNLLFPSLFQEMWLAMILAFILNFILASAGRYLLYRIIYRFRKAGFDQKKVAIYGPKAHELAEKIKENDILGYNIALITTSFSRLKASLKDVDTIFITSIVDDKLLSLMVSESKVNWKVIPTAANLIMDPVTFDEFKDYPIINVAGYGEAIGYAPLKRLLDIVCSGLALLILSPLFLIVAILIKATSKGPLFFIQERLGQNLKPFQLFKFRSMVWPDADQLKDKLEKKNEVKGLFKMKDDPRITKIGKILRKTNIDELPQIINIFRGEMSIVGPRPHLQRELSNFKGWRMARFSAKPGLTGLWQVNGRHELNFDKAVLYDIYYIKHMSLPLDISIIIRTIPSILFSRGRH